MTKSLFLLLFCGCLSLAHAAPIEDDPLPFDTRMPARVAAPAAPDPGVSARDDAEPARAAPRQKCRTVTRKVHGRRVKQQQCTPVREARSSSSRSRQEARSSSRRQEAASTSRRGRQAAKSSRRDRQQASAGKHRTTKKVSSKGRKRR